MPLKKRERKQLSEKQLAEKQLTGERRGNRPEEEARLEVLRRSVLFAGIGRDELEAMLGCLKARARDYREGEFILHAGDAARGVGIVISGRAQIVRENLQGNRMILSGLSEADLFGEAFACLEGAELAVSVEAVTNCQIMWLDVNRIVTVCPSACQFHSRLIQNLLRVLAHKNVELNEKVRLLSLPSTRDKLLDYLSGYARRAGSRRFTIPYNRSQLAEYLGVDRSAMSRELSRMRDAGVLIFERNQFELLETAMRRGEIQNGAKANENLK